MCGGKVANAIPDHSRARKPAAERAAKEREQGVKKIFPVCGFRNAIGGKKEGSRGSQ